MPGMGMPQANPNGFGAPDSSIFGTAQPGMMNPGMGGLETGPNFAGPGQPPSGHEF